MLRNVAEKIVLWYFKKYHKSKVHEILLVNTPLGYYKPMDIISSNNNNYLYLGKSYYFKLGY